MTPFLLFTLPIVDTDVSQKVLLQGVGRSGLMEPLPKKWLERLNKFCPPLEQRV